MVQIITKSGDGHKPACEVVREKVWGKTGY
jgi:hypothetical protein